MAKLSLRRRGVYGKRGAHETNRFTKMLKDGTRREYVLRSDNVVLQKDTWRSSYSGESMNTGWKVVARQVDPVALCEELTRKGFSQ